MSQPPAVQGKRWEPHAYAVGREKIAEFAEAVGERHEVYRDAGAARQAGFAGVVAPPMFAVVYSSAAVDEALADPEVGIDMSKMVHGAQELEWGEPVCDGDVVTTQVQLDEVFDKGDNRFYVFVSTSQNQRDEQVARGTWTTLVRGGAEGGDGE